MTKEAAKQSKPAEETEKKVPAKPKRKPRLPKIAEDQAAFIENKIKALGTLEAVKTFYALNDKVSQYANIKAEEILKT